MQEFFFWIPQKILFLRAILKKQCLWKNGIKQAPIPNQLLQKSMEIDGNFYVIGGYASSDVYKISCASNVCKWIKMNQKLQAPRECFVAMQAPKNSCTNWKIEI